MPTALIVTEIIRGDHRFNLLCVLTKSVAPVSMFDLAASEAMTNQDATKGPTITFFKSRLLPVSARFPSSLGPMSSVKALPLTPWQQAPVVGG